MSTAHQAEWPHPFVVPFVHSWGRAAGTARFQSQWTIGYLGSATKRNESLSTKDPAKHVVCFRQQGEAKKSSFPKAHSWRAAEASPLACVIDEANKAVRVDFIQ